MTTALRLTHIDKYVEKHAALKDGWMRSIEAALETAVDLEL